MVRVRAIFQGRVQGVGFRWTCLETAKPFAVTGLVRNEPDGTVLLEAQGEQDEVNAFLGAVSERLRTNIRDMSTQSLTPSDDERQFRVER